jgi:hypothetical protein
MKKYGSLGTVFAVIGGIVALASAIAGAVVIVKKLLGKNTVQTDYVISESFEEPELDEEELKEAIQEEKTAE